MSYNGSGTFQINTSGQPVVTGTVISSTAFNALTSDLATGLTTAITKDGQTTTTVRIPFSQGINSSLATDTTNGSSGSIYTAGGVGITKALYVGTNATVVGTLGVTGAATFSATPIFSALTASSAVATDASKNLVSVTNTGTGNNVLATSPTLVTPILGTPTSGTLTNCTFPTLNQNTTGTASNVTGTVAVANGGTGSTTLTANNVLLGNGTGALQVVAPSTSGNVLTSNGTTWTSSSPGGIGTGQTWQNVTGSRAVNTTYTNSTGKPIFWHVDINSSNVTPTIDGVAFQTTSSVNGNTNTSAINLIVPVGSTYSTAGGGITFWIELR